MASHALPPPALTTSLHPYRRYSRFEMSSLLEAMDLCQEAYDGRDEQLKGALADQQKIDEAKRSFAAAAEVVVAFCKEEKGSMEAEAPAIQITPDDGAAIVKGKEMLATLEGYTSGAARDKRAAQLAPAQEQWDFLMNASEMDNKCAPGRASDGGRLPHAQRHRSPRLTSCASPSTPGTPSTRCRSSRVRWSSSSSSSATR